jgi:hypothetical protein
VNATNQLKTADTVALFYSVDTNPRFAVKFCNPDSLRAAVEGVMFFGPLTAENHEELELLMEGLLTNGAIDFEDGWLCLRTGITDAVAFVMDKINQAMADALFEDRRRYEQMKRAEAAEAKYSALRDMLKSALGDNAAAVLAVASS